MEDIVDVEQYQSTQKTYNGRNTHVVVQWLVHTELETELYRYDQIGSPQV